MKLKQSLAIIKALAYKRRSGERAKFYLKTIEEKYEGEAIGEGGPIIIAFTVLPKSSLDREADLF